jgi:hypothetical protein
VAEGQTTDQGLNKYRVLATHGDNVVVMTIWATEEADALDEAADLIERSVPLPELYTFQAIWL